MFHQHDLEGPDRQTGRQRQINERHNGGEDWRELFNSDFPGWRFVFLSEPGVACRVKIDWEGCGWVARQPAIISTENYGFHAKLQKPRTEANFYLNISGEQRTSLLSVRSLVGIITIDTTVSQI